MSDRPDYYKILHVQPDAPTEVIKASFRTLMRRLGMHPDLGGEHDRAALINEAFQTLNDPVTRALYDESRREHETAPRSRNPEPGTRHPEPGTRHPEPGNPEPVVPSVCTFCRTPYHWADAEDPDASCSCCGAALCPVQRRLNDTESRRAIDRLPRNLRITFVPASAKEKVCKGITQDISLNGLRFVSRLHMPEGERLIIETDFCSAIGVVRSIHLHRAEPDEWEYGVEFLTMRVKRQRGSLIWTVA